VAVYGFAVNVVYGIDKRTIIQQYYRGEPWDINRYIFSTAYYNYIDMSDIMFDRKVFLECGGYLTGEDWTKSPLYQDYSIMVRLAIKYNNRIGFVPEILTFYAKLFDSQSISVDNDLESHMRIFQ
jgi:hypothetical protein